MDEFRISSESMSETDDRREVIKQKLRQHYDGRIVRKDLTKSIREGANVPIYVLEYLLGQYCNSDNPEIMSLLRERGSYTVIDRITVILNTREDRLKLPFQILVSSAFDKSKATKAVAKYTKQLAEMQL
jgi:ATP-dependent Lon protease